MLFFDQSLDFINENKIEEITRINEDILYHKYILEKQNETQIDYITAFHSFWEYVIDPIFNNMIKYQTFYSSNRSYFWWYYNTLDVWHKMKSITPKDVKQINITHAFKYIIKNELMCGNINKKRLKLINKIRFWFYSKS